MEDAKITLSKNITELRLLNNMTQVELAKHLNYSDKTISKWERGESTPDINVLVEMADLFGVSLDYLIRGANEEIEEKISNQKTSQAKYNHKVILYLSQGLVWFIALFAFIITSLIAKEATFQWLYFVYSLPIVTIIHLIFNSIWFNPRHNYYIISLLMWSILAAIQITFWFFHINISLIYLLGIAGEIIIVMWSFIKKPKK